MAGELDNYILEKQLGNEFSQRLRKNLKTTIQSLTTKKSGLALKSTVNPIFKEGQLHSLQIKTPYYIYPILHVGFEGSKKKGLSKRVSGRNILTKAIEDVRLVQDLADRVGSLRATEIVSNISLAFDLKLKTSKSVINE